MGREEERVDDPDAQLGSGNAVVAVCWGRGPDGAHRHPCAASGVTLADFPWDAFILFLTVFFVIEHQALIPNR